MSTHKIVGFGFSDSTILSYIKIQLDAIKNEQPAVEVESATENDSRLDRLPVNRRNRLPVIIYYKNDVYASHLLGKRDYQEVQGWFNTLGINA